MCNLSRDIDITPQMQQLHRGDDFNFIPDRSALTGTHGLWKRAPSWLSRPNSDHSLLFTRTRPSARRAASCCRVMRSSFARTSNRAWPKTTSPPRGSSSQQVSTLDSHLGGILGLDRAALCCLIGQGVRVSVCVFD